MKKRSRGTAVVFKEEKVLLVRDRGRKAYSLPGGGIKQGEPVIIAAIRELYEETGLVAKKAVRIKEYDYEGEHSFHQVCYIEPENYDITLDSKELDDYLWWDMKEELPLFKHVKGISDRFDFNKIL